MSHDAIGFDGPFSFGHKNLFGCNLEQLWLIILIYLTIYNTSNINYLISKTILIIIIQASWWVIYIFFSRIT